MLRIQSIPMKFPRVMGKIAEEDTQEIDSLLKLSVNFDVEELPSNSLKLQRMTSCLACGNCISRCPYDAKNSTDKKYLLSAIGAGCTVRTECQAQYAVENMHENFQQGKINGKRKNRVFT